MQRQRRHGWQERTLLWQVRRELKRLHIVQKVIEGTLKRTEAAEMLSLSVRQTGRIIIRVKEEEAQGVVHRSRGRESNRKLAKEVKDQVLALYRQHYTGFGPTLAQRSFMRETASV